MMTTLFKPYIFAAGISLISNSNTTLKNTYSSNFENESNVMHHSATRINTKEDKRFSLELLKLNKQRLESFKALSNNWNGYQGQPIHEGIIEYVNNILSELEYQPQIFPTGRGTLQLERYFDEDNFYEIEAFENEAYVYISKNGVESEKEISHEDITKVINEFYG